MDIALFAIQVFLPLEPTSSLHAWLRDSIHRSPPSSGPAGQFRFFRAVSDAIVPWSNYFELGEWDYQGETEVARTSFNDWCEGTVKDAHEAVQNRPPASPYRPMTRNYMFITQLMLVKAGSTSDLHLARICQMPDEALWQKQTFRNLLLNSSQLNFADVVEAALYVRPGIDGPPVSAEEIAQENYAYLKPLV